MYCLRSRPPSEINSARIITRIFPHRPFPWLLCPPKEPPPASRSAACSKQRAGALATQTDAPTSRWSPTSSSRRPALMRLAKISMASVTGLWIFAARRQRIPAGRARSLGRRQIHYQAKSKARRYAREQSCRYVILSTAICTLFLGFAARQSSRHHAVPQRRFHQVTAASRPIRANSPPRSSVATHIALTQLPGYASGRRGRTVMKSPRSSRKTTSASCATISVRSMRCGMRSPSSSRFLFEMATGTGRTLDRRRRHQTLSAHRQRTARAVSG